MAAAARDWRDKAERHSKKSCRPKMAFLRENLVARVRRQSSEFWASSSGCRSRVPTSEECRRSYLVPPAAEPDNREFPAPEMVVVGR